jgi:pimeloyl-ACP methyl ester carboxylesterase
MSISVQNASVYLIDHGSGPPTLFLHGNPDSAELWNDVIAVMSKQYRCLAPDLPGYGRSAPLPNFKVTLENEARWVADLVDELAIQEPLNLVVHDFGAHFGLAWAIRQPERVRRISIMNTNFFSDYRWHYLARLLRIPLIGELGLAFFNEAQYTRQLQRDAPNVPARHIQRTLELYSPAAKQMTLRLYRNTHAGSFIGWEEELLALTQRVPTCVIWGDRDPYVSPTWADRFGAQVVHHLPEVSHWAPVETPQEVAQKLMAFFGNPATTRPD